MLLLNLCFSFIHNGIDLTQDKRYTLTSESRQFAQQIDEPIELTVYLEGDIPVGFKKLANAVENISAQFNRLSNGKFTIRFEKPGEGMPDSLKLLVYDSLQKMGIHPTNVKAQVEENDQTQETLVFPGAILSGKNAQVGIDFIEGQNSLDGMNALNNAESQLEFKITKAIKLIQRDRIPLVGYLTGNGEVLDLRVYDLIENVIKKEYRFSIIPIDSVLFIPKQVDVLLINKPQIPFTAFQKLALDQYIMKGGKVIWALDNLYASMDSLQKSKGSFVAFDLGLNLDDQLFKYGVRINRDLVQDLDCDQVPSIVGSVGDKPQIQLLPWPYAPLLNDRGVHPISRNLDKILSAFPQSIDTVSAASVSTSVLLSTSVYGRKLPTPAIVEWKSIKTEEDLKNFSTSYIPVAVLLEGKFSSLFKNRISLADAGMLSQQTDSKFLSETASDNKMIVVSDGDLFLNPVSESDGPLSMGTNTYTRLQYANKEFLKNCLFYLTDGKEALASRTKTYRLRMLDKEHMKEHKNSWRWFNLLAALLVPFMASIAFRLYRKRRYSRLLV